MDKGLEKKYGLPTAIAMIVGIVIGSGVFFKADDVLEKTDGNVVLALIAWSIGALAMIFGALVFSEFAQRIEKSNGLVDYTEIAYGKRAGYLAGWFNLVLYLLPLVAILSWITSMYTLILMGSENPENSAMTWILAIIYMLLIYVINYYSPLIAGKLQVSAMIIKLIPLGCVGILGVVLGMKSGVGSENITNAMSTIKQSKGTLPMAIVGTAFAYEGWIVALTINSEIKNAKKNLPKALTVGTIIVFIVYVLYFLGISSSLPTSQIVAEGNNSVAVATTKLFGSTASSILIVFVIISCIGTLNGLILSVMRGAYTLAIRNQGPMPNLMKKIDPKTNMPINSTIFSLISSLLYLALWYASLNKTFGRYIGLDEIPIVMMYGLYVILYVYYIKEFKDLGFVKRFVIPIFALIGAGIILYGGFSNPDIGIYMLISILGIFLGLLFYRKDDIELEEIND